MVRIEGSETTPSNAKSIFQHICWSIINILAIVWVCHICKSAVLVNGSGGRQDYTYWQISSKYVFSVKVRMSGFGPEKDPF